MVSIRRRAISCLALLVGAVLVNGCAPNYEIWNEPGHMTPGQYANLVRRAVPVIREADPEARIIIGAIMGTWEDGYPGYGEHERFRVELEYLNQVLQSGVLPLVDGVSWHPFYDNVPSDPYYQEYPSIVRDILRLAELQGFTGEYFANELLWRTVTEEGWAVVCLAEAFGRQ